MRLINSGYFEEEYKLYEISYKTEFLLYEMVNNRSSKY